MASVNKVFLMGHLGAEAEGRFLPNGMQACTFSLATHARWTDEGSGEIQERTDWHRLKAYGRNAEIVLDYTRKGSLVHIEGELRTDTWKDKETGEDRFATYVRIERLQLCGSRPGTASADEAPEDSAERGRAPGPSRS
jgi:single-strand DNA-binding protein